jgi:hypothetical protein
MPSRRTFPTHKIALLALGASMLISTFLTVALWVTGLAPDKTVEFFLFMWGYSFVFVFAILFIGLGHNTH